MIEDVVLYLCQNAAEPGWVFPNELPDGYYSPGIWVVAKYKKKKLKNKYFFDAHLNGEIITLDLVRGNSVFGYSVTVEDTGTILFHFEPLGKDQKYIGNHEELKEFDEFYQVVPYDIALLEVLCFWKKFFFVGRAIETRL